MVDMKPVSLNYAHNREFAGPEGRDKARPTELTRNSFKAYDYRFHKAVIRSRSGGHALSLHIPRG